LASLAVVPLAAKLAVAGGRDKADLDPLLRTN